MSVARFCTCGFLLPAHAADKACPACGRVQGIPTTRLEPLRIEPTPPANLGYQAVEVGSDGTVVPPTERDDLSRKRSKTYLAIQSENNHERDRVRRNQWTDPGTLSDCFMFPLKSIVWVLILAWSWSALLIIGVRIIDVSSLAIGIATAVVGLVFVVVTGFTHRLLQYAYASSSVGHAAMLNWPSFHIWAEIKAGVRGIVGLLAGPIPVALFAGWFYLNSGLMQAYDALIVVELVTVALTWWILLVIASHEYGSVSPVAIGRWFESVGWIPVLATAGMMTVVTFILWFAAAVILASQSEGFFLQIIFLPASLVWIFALIFLLLRWLGVRIRKRAAEPLPA